MSTMPSQDRGVPAATRGWRCCSSAARSCGRAAGGRCPCLQVSCTLNVACVCTRRCPLCRVLTVVFFFGARVFSISAATSAPPPPPPPPPPPVESWVDRCASCAQGLITSSQLAVRDVARTCCQSFCRACIAERFCLEVEDGLRCQVCRGRVTSWQIRYLDALGTLGNAVVFTTPDARRWRIGRRIRERSCGR